MARQTDKQRPTIAGASVFSVIDAAAARGVDRAALLSCAGLRASEQGDPDVRVPLARLYSVWDAIMRALRDPAFPIAAAMHAAPAGYEMLSFLATTSPTFGDALRRVSRYLRLWTNSLRWEVREEGEIARIVLVRDGALVLGRRCSDESATAELVASARSLSGADFTPRVVRFAHPPPPAIAAHRAFFRSRVDFDAARTEIVFDRAWMSRAMPKADAAMHRFFERQADAALSMRDAPASITEQVERAVLEQLDENVRAMSRASPWRVPSFGDIARQLGMSTRSLRRRLADEGTTFEHVLTAVRESLARQHLAEQRLAIADVAYALGFSEPSAFHRAFKRWTGLTPLAFRRGEGAPHKVHPRLTLAKNPN